MITIAFLAGQLGLGGAERQLFYLASGLDCRRFAPRVINLSPELDSYWAGRLLELDIPVLAVPRDNPLSRLLQIRRALDVWETDIIHSFHFHVNSYAVLANWRRPAPVIGAIRNLPVQAHLGKVSTIRRWLGLYGVDCLVCNAQASRQTLNAAYPDLKDVRVIVNGVRVPPENELERLRYASAVELGKKNADLFIGYIGHLYERKNVPLLIEAIDRLSPDFPQMKTFIIGNGRQRPQLEAQVRSLELQQVIRFTGFRPLAEELVPALEVLCLPSNFEGMPNVLMEASAMGVPVVASNIAGIPEVVIDGQTGLLFHPGNLEELVNQLRRLLESHESRTRLGQAGRAYMQDNFSIERMVQQYQALYISQLEN